MNPAYSVIFFTVASGAGYGLLVCLATLHLSQPWHGLAMNPASGFAGGVLGLALVTAGLLSSMLHLGHPERAWRAVSQWRTSWLSREGLAAMLTYLPAAVFTSAWLLDGVGNTAMSAAAVATVLLSLFTVGATGMIYASLKPVPHWHNAWVVPVYLALALASGALLVTAILSVTGSATPALLWLCVIVLVLAWSLKGAYWRHVANHESGSTAATATGLGRFGEVRSLEAPHTSENWLMREMGFVVARKHAARLRRIAVTAGLVIPVIAMALGAVTAGWLRAGFSVSAVASALSGLLVERWLFFAEARHVVMLYYGTGHPQERD